MVAKSFIANFHLYHTSIVNKILLIIYSFNTRCTVCYQLELLIVVYHSCVYKTCSKICINALMFSNFRSIDFPVFTFTAFGNARTRINDNSSRFVSTEDVYCSIIINERSNIRRKIFIKYIFKTLYFFRESTWRYRSTSKVTQLVASYQIVSDCGISNYLIIMKCVTSILALPLLFICNIDNATSTV